MNDRFKLLIVLSFGLCSLFGFLSCSDEDSDLVGNWIKRSDFGGPIRAFASSFVIGRKAYVVGGYTTKKRRLNDIWEYNIDQGYWTQKADFPGTARNAAFAFASEDKGYYGTGTDATNNYGDFWEFDPDNNQWTQKADFPGGARYGVTAFYLNGTGYAGTGLGTNYYMDFYKYDPATDTWETGVSIQGSKRANATSFIIDNKAYVVGGLNSSGYPTDFWMFDPDTQTWEQKAQIGDKTDDDFDDDYTTITRLNTVSFVINGLGYLATGETGGLNSYTWEYNPITDRWTERTSFEGTARTGAVGFSIDNRGFVLTGTGSTSSTDLYFDDMWEFKPRDEYNEYD
ncbi:Kelch repeat-containing protein [Proteiniphilum acetatigenes]|uniref:Kelch repeat-containing protein n=1 Tax=Proteiniphilum acetatigenes TaxID=294710 RepID=UPI00036A07C0|nr:kelch repeat-containing protein [Proteiniphilum acetatigenes]